MSELQKSDTHTKQVSRLWLAKVDYLQVIGDALTYLLPKSRDSMHFSPFPRQRPKNGSLGIEGIFSFFLSPFFFWSFLSFFARNWILEVESTNRSTKDSVAKDFKGLYDLHFHCLTFKEGTRKWSLEKRLWKLSFLFALRSRSDRCPFTYICGLV